MSDISLSTLTKAVPRWQPRIESEEGMAMEAIPSWNPWLAKRLVGDGAWEVVVQTFRVVDRMFT